MKVLVRSIVAMTLGGLSVVSSVAIAHGGVTGRYDASRPILISGMVVEATFSPPHPTLSIKVDVGSVPTEDLGRRLEYYGPVVSRPEDTGQVRMVELSPVPMFYELEGKLQPGDRVSLVALENCNSPRQLRSTWIRLTRGQIISSTGDWAPGVDGC